MILPLFFEKNINFQFRLFWNLFFFVEQWNQANAFNKFDNIYVNARATGCLMHISRLVNYFWLEVIMMIMVQNRFFFCSTANCNAENVFIFPVLLFQRKQINNNHCFNYFFVKKTKLTVTVTLSKMFLQILGDFFFFSFKGSG